MEQNVIEITNYGSPIPVYMHGILIGHWQMLSVRGNLLVTPEFIPIDKKTVFVEATHNF